MLSVSCLDDFDAMDMQHQFPSQDVVLFLPCDLTLAVLNDEVAVLPVHEVGRVDGILLYRHVLEYRLGDVQALDGGILEPVGFAGG